jgi:hypothetical protein
MKSFASDIIAFKAFTGGAPLADISACGGFLTAGSAAGVSMVLFLPKLAILTKDPTEYRARRRGWFSRQVMEQSRHSIVEHSTFL